MEVTLRGRAVAKVTDDDFTVLVVALQVRCHPEAGRVRDVVADADVEWEDALVDQRVVTRLVAGPVVEILGREAADDGRGVFTVLVEQPVGVLKRVHRPEAGALLASHRRVRPESPLPLEAHHPVVEVTTQFHVGVQRHEFVVGQRRLVAVLECAVRREKADTVVVRAVEERPVCHPD